ncbi:holin-like protein [Mariniphaga anaerophila]|uniref:Holin-like protein n=1 Tax=Mariniphaga anaerophila TaxID=1484053 RepID=A0A1M4YBF3_9BACT|nr:CidA/LrgA family protein [Mariniphaga anaerophila]SHF02906.1 holin-like protein [Mariniphaga anaerophila]
MIRQCAIIFGCLAIGELIVHFTSINLPSSIIGMLLLTLLLKLEWIKLEWIKGIADFLVNALPFFFVPAGVAVMLYYDLIFASFWEILVASFGSTIIVLVVTGWTHQHLRVRTKKNRSKREKLIAR